MTQSRMKCAVVVLLSIINCEGINDEAQKPGENDTPNFLPFQMPPFFGPTDYSRGEETFFQRTQQYQTTAPATTPSRIVETKYGKLQGLTVTVFPGSNNVKNLNPIKNKLVDVFLSVPYALPPTKSYRFSPTQAPVPWEGVKTVIKPGFVCPQVMPETRDETAALKDMPKGYFDYLRKVEPYLRNQSEDCLYLNIFTPALSSAAGGATSSSSSVISSDSTKLRLKPVLVFVHGGKFSWGSGNLYDGTLLAAYADMLFITLNYRLGVLGFLNVNTSPNTKPRVANYGLMDQIAALHWIKGNIASFGGDPENITMMGYESGAACIHFLISSPAVVPGLFHRVILIGASAHAPWALVDDPAGVATALAESLNCSINLSAVTNSSNSHLATTALNQPSGREKDQGSKTPPSEPLIDCLKNKHFSYFAKFATPKFAVDFGPSVDGIVIPNNFWSYTEPQYGKKEQKQSFDMLFGLSSSEMLTSFAERDLVAGIESPRREAILRTLIRNSYRFHRNEILATIANEYVDWERGVQHPMSARDFTLNAVTDCLSLAPLIAASESAYIKQSYFYVFDHSTKEGLYTFQKNGGAGGGEDLNYFLGFPLMEKVLPFFPSPFPSNYTKSEMALSEMLITYLSNFVYTGNPEEPNQGELVWPLSKEKNKFRNVGWDSYDRLHQKFLEISASKIRIRSHYRAHQMAVWLRLVPELERTGASFVSALHNRMHGGFDPTLYVGGFRLPEELEAANEIHHYLDSIDHGDFYYNGSGISPSPPTCFSPLSSISSGIGKGNVGASITRPFEERQNGTLPQNSFMTAYANNLPLTIGVGCSLLILNIFIFAILYYHHDKRRSSAERRLLSAVESSAVESQQLHSYVGVGSEPPPELLQSNSTTATSFHQSQSQSQSLYSYDDESHDFYHRQPQHKKHGGGANLAAGENVNLATFSDHERRREIMSATQDSRPQLVQNSAGENMSLARQQQQQQQQPSGIYFSQHTLTHQQPPLQTTTIRITKPQKHQSNHYQPQEHQQQILPHQQFDHINVNIPSITYTGAEPGTESAQIVSQPHANVSFTLPIRRNDQQHRPTLTITQHPGESGSVATSSFTTTLPGAPGSGSGTSSLPRKPTPPTRNISNFTITQRQLFSVIISLLTLGIL